MSLGILKEYFSHYFGDRFTQEKEKELTKFYNDCPEYERQALGKRIIELLQIYNHSCKRIDDIEKNTILNLNYCKLK